MKNEFTPGPWKFVPGTVEGDLIGTEDGAVAFCKMRSWENQPTLLEMQANARLIAAAPDLLEALEVILPLAIEWVDSDDNRQRGRIYEAQAAIAKARGEA